MKGRIILVPIKEPKEGMKVVWKDTPGFPSHELYIRSIKGNKVGVSGGRDNLSIIEADLSELQQIAVEYYEDTSYIADRPHVFPKATMLIEKVAKKSILLSPDDYEKALPLMGQEVEFEEKREIWQKPTQILERVRFVARLITPSPKEETWEDIWTRYVDFKNEHNQKYVGQFLEWLKYYYHPAKKKQNE